MPHVDDVVEVVVLGKGIGECVLISTRPDEWVVVDSFRAPRGDPAAIEYLVDRGVDPARGVGAVILTHLHADHSEGIDDLFARCPQAVLAMPRAIPDRDWDKILAQLNDEEPPRSTKMREIATAFRLATDTGRFRPMGIDSFANTVAPELWALSPLGAMQLAAHRASLPAAEEAARSVLLENYTSIVLWLRAGAANALLGADMDRNGVVGWSGLLRDHELSRRATERARLVKVPHHGSWHAHDPDIYARWTDRALAVLTPNRRSHLPKDRTVAELKDLCAGVWQAGPLAGRPLGDHDVRGSGEVVAIECRGSRSTGDWTVRNAVHQRL